MPSFDLSHPIESGCPVFPGDPHAEIKALTTAADYGYATTLVSFCSHTGTHMDAPSHIFEDGRNLDSFPVSQFMGKAAVIDCSHCVGEIDLRCIVENESRLSGVDFVLLKTNWSNFWGEPCYFSGYPTLSPDAAAFLGSGRFKGIGIDTPSPDAADNINLPAHKALLAGGKTVLIENLANLDLLKGEMFSLVALPLKWTNADGAPTRVVASNL